MKISRILHAGYLVESHGTQLLFDPIFENPFSRNCHAFPSVQFDHAQIAALRPDAIFISHFHDDHCSFDSLHLLPRSTPVYLYCLFEELFTMLRALGFTDVRALAIDDTVRIGTVEVIARRALDDDVDAMFHLRAEGLNVLNVVDAWMDPQTLKQLERYAPWDMVLWPFQTMREVDVIAPSRAVSPLSGLDGLPALPEEWPEQLRALNPRFVVPSACQFVQEPWSWYNHAMFPVTYRQFSAAVAQWLPGAQVVRLNPGVAVELTAQALAPAAPLPWVLPVGEQEVDFDYRPAIVPPSTASIAQRFPALGSAQAALVDAYCRVGLLDKYVEMELADDSYFTSERLWQLTVFNHDGTGRSYRYRIHGDHIAPAEEGGTAAGRMDEAGVVEVDDGGAHGRNDGTAHGGWRTEIPAAKLYAGLALGESLTSMYVRIDGAPADADIADDPLIRCLFNDAFGAYQAAQLRRITGAGG